MLKNLQVLVMEHNYTQKDFWYYLEILNQIPTIQEFSFQMDLAINFDECLDNNQLALLDRLSTLTKLKVSFGMIKNNTFNPGKVVVSYHKVLDVFKMYFKKTEKVAFNIEFEAATVSVTNTIAWAKIQC